MPAPVSAFGAELRDVFADTVSRASHHPAAFCLLLYLLLLLFTACFHDKSYGDISVYTGVCQAASWENADQGQGKTRLGT